METVLSPQDLEFKEYCLKYAREELEPLARKLGEINDVPTELKESLGRSGLYGHLFPEEYGGKGVSAVRICLAREVLAGVFSPADTTLAMQGLGGYPIVLAGTEEQKKKYIPAIVSGESLATFALTEPGAGSDVAAMTTTAELKDGSYVINGRKRFISNGYSADVAALFAKTPDTGDPRSISAFVLEKGMKGFDVAKRMELIASHDIVEFEINELTVPRENMLGEVGDGFKLAMRTLDLMRMSVGAAAVGMAKAALEEALSFAKKRVQFGQPIVQYQAISSKLAEMATEIEAARALVYLAAIKKDREDPQVSLASSMAKLYATEAAFRVIDQAVQIHGGIGVMKGSAVERLFREIRPLRIYEGTTEIQKVVIATRLLKG
jgi:alkylation response protein AidB-like acyl-CoA dehydrogenase